MTNKEFYGDKLLAVALIHSCGNLYRAVKGNGCGNICSSCEFNSDEKILQWLNAEHKEPLLLENGDELKPGDWIMVRNNEDCAWVNQQFLAYFDGWFYARIIVPDGWREKIDRFRQARLPEEGEENG